MGYGVTGAFSIMISRASIHIPIAVVSCFGGLLTCIVVRDWRTLWSQAWSSLSDEWRKQWRTDEQKGKSLIPKVIIYIIIGIYVVSIGPVNQPDAADYHAGYPYQFFLHQRYIIDGGLTQGLMGLGDFAHLSSFQERTTWLIRSIQILPLLPLVLVLKKYKTSNLWILALLTAPVFIGWATVGKPMFLGDSCIAGSYLAWAAKPDKTRASLLATSLILGISFKVSALIIALPITLDIAYRYIKNNKKDSETVLPGSKITWIMPLASLALFTILIIDRWHLTGNPAFPLLTKLFTPLNLESQAFESYLKSFGRDDSRFPLSLFIPFKPGNLASVLGPACGLISVTSIATIFWKHTALKQITLVAMMQLLCLGLFGQWRADYYSVPIILLAAGGIPNHKWPEGTEILRFTYKAIYGFSLTTQIIIFALMATMSIYQTGFAMINYDSAMNQWAYGYQASRELMGIKKPSLNLAFRETRLFYDKNYIDPSQYRACLREQMVSHAHVTDQQLAESCLVKIGAKRVLVNSGELNNSKTVTCHQKSVFLGQRNLFNNRRVMVDYCDINPK